MGLSLVSLFFDSCHNCSKVDKGKSNTYISNVSYNLIESYAHDSIDYVANAVQSNTKEYVVDSIFIKFSVVLKAVAWQKDYSFGSLYACDFDPAPMNISNIQSIKVTSDQDWNKDFLAGSDLSEIMNLKKFGVNGFKKANLYMSENSYISNGFLSFIQSPNESKTHNITIVYNFGSYSVVNKIEGLKIKSIKQ